MSEPKKLYRVRVARTEVYLATVRADDEDDAQQRADWLESNVWSKVPEDYREEVLGVELIGEDEKE